MRNWHLYLQAHHPPSIRSDEPEYCKEVRRAIDKIPDSWNREGRILSLGCGDGYEMSVLEEKGFKRIIGVTNDNREKIVNPDLDIVLCDMHDMLFADNYFNFVYSKETLEHSIAPYPLLCELNRVMKRDGEFLHFISSSMEKQREIYHFSAFPDWLWIDLFHKTGFEVKTIYEHSIQLGFYGIKTKNIDFFEKPEHYSYDLNGLINNIKRVKLEL